MELIASMGDEAAEHFRLSWVHYPTRQEHFEMYSGRGPNPVVSKKLTERGRNIGFSYVRAGQGRRLGRPSDRENWNNNFYGTEDHEVRESSNPHPGV